MCYSVLTSQVVAVRVSTLFFPSAFDRHVTNTPHNKSVTSNRLATHN